MEAARDFGCSFHQLCELLRTLDRIEAERLKRTGRFKTPPKHRLTVEQRVKRLCGIKDEEETA
jgi:hypothetical protein